MSTYDDLFPSMKPLGLCHVTGPPGVGKSLFAVGLVEVGLDPKRIAVIDCEQSLLPHHAALGFGFYIDAIGEFVKQSGLTGSPRNFLNLILKTADALRARADEFDVVIVDNIQPLEDGFVDEVETNSVAYGLSPAQIQRGGGLKWGPIKRLYSAFSQSLSAIAPIYIFTSHLRQVWAGGGPVPGLFKPVGKGDVLERQTWLRLWLLYNPHSIYPDGLVLKDRLVRPVSTNGATTWQPILPRKLCPANWARIIECINEPADRDNPRPGEAPTLGDWAKLKGTLTKDQLEILRLAAATAETAGRAPTVPATPAKSTVPATQAEFVLALPKLGITLTEALKRLGKKSISEIDPRADFTRLQ